MQHFYTQKITSPKIQLIKMKRVDIEYESDLVPANLIN